MQLAWNLQQAQFYTYPIYSIYQFAVRLLEIQNRDLFCIQIPNEYDTKDKKLLLHEVHTFQDWQLWSVLE